MNKVRRRVIRLALLLQVAGIEPVFEGHTYREMQTGLEKQWSVLTSNQRRAVRRKANHLISTADGLKNAGNHLVPSLHEEESAGRQIPIDNSRKQIRHCASETPRCSVCRMRGGLPKRSWPSQEVAEQVREQQNDPRLVVYSCPAGAGWHLGHRPDIGSPSASHPATTIPRREPHRAYLHVASMLPTTLHRKSPMKMSATLANPLLIAIYSAALLLIGCAVGVHWAHTPATARWLAIAGGVLMAVHDTATGVLWFWLTARWAHSVTHRNNHS